MEDTDIILWHDADTPALAVSESGSVAYYDHARKNYGTPGYILIRRKQGCAPQYSTAETWGQAKAWFAKIEELLKEHA